MPYEFVPNIREIAHRLKAKSQGSNGFIGCCPSHDDKKPSFSLKSTLDDKGAEKILMFCHAGCTYEEIVKSLIDKGVWPRFINRDGSMSDFPKKVDYRASNNRQNTSYTQAPMPKPAAPKKRGTPLSMAFKKDRTPSKEDLLVYAKQLWREADKDMALCEDYMKWRGLSGKVPYYAKFHKEKSLMLSPVMTWQGKVIGLHRTHITSNGDGFEYDKKSIGDLYGGVIFLDKMSAYMSSPDIAVGEGIETSTAWHEDTGIPSISGMSSSLILRVRLPMIFRNCHLLEDCDLPDEKGIIKSQRLYDKVSDIWISNGINVYRHNPKVNLKNGEKGDWLDMHVKDPALARESVANTLPYSGMEGEPYAIEW